MLANEPLYVVCSRGVFFLPDAIFDSLSDWSRNGFVYMRQDEDMLTISATKIAEGHRRQLLMRYRAPMFRDARRLAIVNLNDSLRIMAVEANVLKAGPGSAPL